MVFPQVWNEGGKTPLSLPKKAFAFVASDTASSTVYQRFAMEPHGVDVRRIYCGIRTHSLSGDLSWKHQNPC